MPVGGNARPQMQHQQLCADGPGQLAVRAEHGFRIRRIALADPLADLLGHVEHRHRKIAQHPLQRVRAVMPALVHHEFQAVARGLGDDRPQ